MGSLRHIGFGLSGALLFSLLVVVHDLGGLWTAISTSKDGGAILALMLVSFVFVFSGIGALISIFLPNRLGL